MSLDVLYDVAHFASQRHWCFLSAGSRPKAIRMGVKLLRRYGGRVRISALGPGNLGSGFPMIWQRGRQGRFGPLRGKMSPE